MGFHVKFIRAAWLGKRCIAIAQNICLKFQVQANVRCIRGIRERKVKQGFLRIIGNADMQ